MSFISTVAMDHSTYWYFSSTHTIVYKVRRHLDWRAASSRTLFFRSLSPCLLLSIGEFRDQHWTVFHFCYLFLQVPSFSPHDDSSVPTGCHCHRRPQTGARPLFLSLAPNTDLCAYFFLLFALPSLRTTLAPALSTGLLQVPVRLRTAP